MLMKVLFNLSVRLCSCLVMQLAAAVIEVECKWICVLAVVQVFLVRLVFERTTALEKINVI